MSVNKFLLLFLFLVITAFTQDWLTGSTTWTGRYIPITNNNTVRLNEIIGDNVLDIKAFKLDGKTNTISADTEFLSGHINLDDGNSSFAAGIGVIDFSVNSESYNSVYNDVSIGIDLKRYEFTIKLYFKPSLKVITGSTAIPANQIDSTPIKIIMTDKRSGNESILYETPMRRIKYVYATNAGMHVFFDDGTVSSCARCDFCKYNLVNMEKSEETRKYIETKEYLQIEENKYYLSPNVVRVLKSDWPIINYEPQDWAIEFYNQDFSNVNRNNTEKPWKGEKKSNQYDDFLKDGFVGGAEVSRYYSHDHIIADLTNLASMAQQYYRKPAALGGGGNTFTGWDIPGNLKSNENGNYFVEKIDGQSLYVIGERADKISSLKVRMKVYPDEIEARVIN